MYKQALLESHKQLSDLMRAGHLTDFAIIGAMAISIYAEPRATADIDYAIKLGQGTLEETASLLGGTSQYGDVFDPLLGTISFYIHSTPGNIPIQCVQFHPAVEKIAFEEVSELTFSRTKLRVVNRRALIILKLFAGSALDIDDASKMLKTTSLTESDMKYLKKKAQSLRIGRRLNSLLETTHS